MQTGFKIFAILSMLLILGCDQGNKTFFPVTVNQAPGITSIPPTSVTTFEDYVYQVETIDEEGDPVTVSLEVAPAGMTIDANGLILWTPTFDDVGAQFVKILATDGTHDPAIQSYFINVIEGPALILFSEVNPFAFVVGSPDVSITATGVPSGGTITFLNANDGGTGGIFTFPVAEGDPTSSPATFSFGGPIEGGTVSVSVVFDPPAESGLAQVTTVFQIAVVFPDGTNVFRSNPELIIPESGGGSVSDTIAVSGAPTSLTNLVVLLNLPNTFAGDLQIFLVHEDSGIQAELTTGNGGGGFNFFAPVIFDDFGVDGSVLSVSAPGGRHVPESPLSIFNGLDANGSWRIQIEDVLGIDVGRLLTWVLIFEGDPVPELRTFGTSWDLENNFGGDIASIPDGGVRTSTVPVLFAPTTITEIRLKVEVFSGANTDLTFQLTSPAGATVTLSSNNGGGTFTDVGIIFDATATTPISGFLETPGNPEPFPSFIPENSLAPLFVGDPNGDWVLTVSDNGGNPADGLIREWTISFNGDRTIF